MSSRLALYNGALRLCRQRKLAALTDAVESRRLLDDEYASVLRWAAEQGNWNHSSVSVAIEASVDVQPSFGFTYAVAKPTDWVNTISIGANGDFNPPFGANEFIDEGAYWNCNVDPLYVRYVSDNTVAGLDLSLWPATYELFVQHELAFRIAPHLTSMGEAAMKELERKRDATMRDARSFTAMNGPPMRAPVGRLVLSRTGGRVDISQFRRG